MWPETVRLVEAEGRRTLSIQGDTGDPSFCRSAVADVIDTMGRIDILVNNAAEQPVCETIEETSDTQLERAFRSVVFSSFFLTRAALPLIPEGGAIVNTTSASAYLGDPDLISGASANGAIVTFTRSLAKALRPRGIRVNAVAVGMVDGCDPEAVAGSYIFLASSEAGAITGQVLHPEDGFIVNG